MVADKLSISEEDELSCYKDLGVSRPRQLFIYTMDQILMVFEQYILLFENKDFWNKIKKDHRE